MGQPSNSVTIRRNSLRESVPGRVGERSRGSGPPVLSLPKDSKAGRLLLVPVLSEARGPAQARDSLGRFDPIVIVVISFLGRLVPPCCLYSCYRLNPRRCPLPGPCPGVRSRNDRKHGVSGKSVS